MDSSNLGEAASSTDGIHKFKDDDPTEIIQSKCLHFSPPTHRQNWSIPDSIFYYIVKNPSLPKLYEKLIRSCKFFFYKNPIIVCFRLTYICRQVGDKVTWQIEQNDVQRNIKLDNSSAKLWITEKIDADVCYSNISQNLISLIIPNLYRFEAKNFYFNDQTISLNEYIFLASSAEVIHFDRNVIITNEDGSIIALEKLIEISVKAKNIEIDLGNGGLSISFQTVTNLFKIPHFATIDCFELKGIPESFDIDTFSKYAKQNKHTGFLLHFSYSISEAYKHRLEAFVDKILDAETLDYKPPYINGIDIHRRRKLLHLLKQINSQTRIQ